MTDEQIDAYIRKQAAQWWAEFQAYWRRKQAEAESQGDYTKVVPVLPKVPHDV